MMSGHQLSAPSTQLRNGFAALWYKLLRHAHTLATLHQVVIGLAVLLPSLYSAAQTAEAPLENVQRLIKEAIRAQPIRNSHIARQRKFDDAFRAEFRAMILQNRDFAQALAKMDKIKQLMTAESFVDPAVADSDLQELHNYVALEQDNGEKTDKLLADLRHTLETADWVASQREHLLNSFEVLLKKGSA